MKKKSNKSFIIFSGGNYRAIIAFCRELRSLGVDFYIIARTESDLILKTNYRRDVVAVRATDELDLDDIGSCIRQVKAAAGTSRFVISPSTEFLNQFLLKHRDFFLGYGCEIPLVGLRTYQCVSNKYTFSEICKNRGIRVPEAYEDYADMSFPFVAKPRTNINRNDKSLYPYLIYNERDLCLFEQKEEKDDFFFQTFISGQSYYLLFYFSRDKKVYKYSQQNILQQYGGKSIALARSALVHTHPIAERFTAVLAEMDFFGLAMIEVILCDGDFFLIELNPRFWGPSQLFVDAGSHIFRAFICDCIEGNTSGVPHEHVKSDAWYLWLNGVIENVVTGKKMTWHVDRPGQRLQSILKSIRHDVYLRSDSVKLFLYELYNLIAGKQRPELPGRMHPFNGVSYGGKTMGR